MANGFQFIGATGIDITIRPTVGDRWSLDSERLGIKGYRYSAYGAFEAQDLATIYVTNVLRDMMIECHEAVREPRVAGTVPSKFPF